MVQETVGFGKEAGLQSGQVGRTERGSFLDLRPINRAVENVGEPLHSPVGACHAAIDTKRLYCAGGVAPIGLHCGEEIGSLKAHALERSACQFARPGSARQAEQRTARVWPPMRR